jgi:hypothetical protein
VLWELGHHKTSYTSKSEDKDHILTMTCVSPRLCREAYNTRQCVGIGGDVDDYVQTRISVLVCDTPPSALYPQPQPPDALSNTCSALLHILTMPLTPHFNDSVWHRSKWHGEAQALCLRNRIASREADV